MAQRLARDGAWPRRNDRYVPRNGGLDQLCRGHLRGRAQGQQHGSAVSFGEDLGRTDTLYGYGEQIAVVSREIRYGW